MESSGYVLILAIIQLLFLYRVQRSNFCLVPFPFVLFFLSLNCCWYFSGKMTGRRVQSQVQTQQEWPVFTYFIKSTFLTFATSFESRMVDNSQLKMLLTLQFSASLHRFLACSRSLPIHFISTFRLLPIDPSNPSPMWNPACRVNCSKRSQYFSCRRTSSFLALLRAESPRQICRQVLKTNCMMRCVSIVFPSFFRGLSRVKNLLVSNSRPRSRGVFQKPRKKGQLFSRMMPPFLMTASWISALMRLKWRRKASRLSSRTCSKQAILRYMKIPWTLLPSKHLKLPDSLSSIWSDISSEPFSPAPITSRLVIFQMAFSRRMVQISFLGSPSSTCSLMSRRASKGLMEILLIELHIFQSGLRAFTSIEYMKMIVEKISRMVMKQLLIMLMIELILEVPRSLKVIEQSLPSAKIFSTSMQLLRGSSGCVTSVKSPGYRKTLPLTIASKNMMGEVVSKEARMRSLIRSWACCQGSWVAASRQGASMRSMEGSLLNQVLAEMRGRMMMRLMIMTMIFFWICYFSDSPSLKFSLLLLIFSFDCFFISCSRSTSSPHRLSISRALTLSTFLLLSGSSLKVCSSRSMMLLISKVLLSDCLTPGALLELTFEFLYLFWPRRTNCEPPPILDLDFLASAYSEEASLFSVMRSSEMGSRLLSLYSIFLGSSSTVSQLGSSSLTSDFSLLYIAVSVLKSESPATDSVMFLLSLAFCSQVLRLVLRKWIKSRMILAARPPMRERRLARTTLARVSTAGRSLLTASQLSTQGISMTIEAVEMMSTQKQKEQRSCLLRNQLSNASRTKTQMTTMCRQPSVKATSWSPRVFTKSITKMLQMVRMAIARWNASLLAKPISLYIPRDIRRPAPAPQGQHGDSAPIPSSRSSSRRRRASSASTSPSFSSRRQIIRVDYSSFAFVRSKDGCYRMGDRCGLCWDGSKIIKMSILFIGERRPFINSPIIMSSEGECQQAEKRRKQQIYREELLLQIRQKKERGRREREYLTQAKSRYWPHNLIKTPNIFRRDLLARPNLYSSEEGSKRPQFIDYIGQLKQQTPQSRSHTPLQYQKPPLSIFSPLKFDSFTPIKFDFSHLNRRTVDSRLRTESICNGRTEEAEWDLEGRRQELRSYGDKKIEQVYRKMQESVEALNSAEGNSPIIKSRLRELRQEPASRSQLRENQNPEDSDLYQLPPRLKQSRRKEAADTEGMSWKERFARLKLRELEDHYQERIIDKQAYERGERTQTPSFHRGK